MSWPPRRPRLPKASTASAAPLTNRTGRSASSNRRCSRNDSRGHRQILANQFRRLRTNFPDDLRRHVRPHSRQPLMNEPDHLVAPGHAQEAGPVEWPSCRGDESLRSGDRTAATSHTRQPAGIQKIMSAPSEITHSTGRSQKNGCSVIWCCVLAPIVQLL